MIEIIAQYPLSWPDGWNRTKYPVNSRYGDHTLVSTIKKIDREIRLFGGSRAIVSTNAQTNGDGSIRSNYKEPSDKGVAVYFEYDGQSMCFACDKWTSITCNAWAIYLAIEALRSIERTGSSDMMARAFTGFAALPNNVPQWWDVLRVAPSATRSEVRSAYLSLAKVMHPDVIGGSDEQFKRLTVAYDEALSKCPV